MIKVTNVRVDHVMEQVTIQCPNCLKFSTYSIEGKGKFIAIRPCYKCEAILTITCVNEEEKVEKCISGFT